MPQCPKCKTDYQSGDKFCISCGQSLPKPEVKVSGGILLKREELASIAGSYEYNSLSPMAVHYQGRTEKKPVELEQKVLGTVLDPERAFFFIEITRDSFDQEVLLAKDSGYYLWKEKDSEVSISREKSPREFIQRTEDMLVQRISERDTSSISISRKSFETLSAVYALCKSLSGIGPAASFVTLSQLESFTEKPEGLNEDVKELSDNGFIRCIGNEDPIIVLEKKAEELLLFLKEYERYYIIQVLSGSSKEYTTLNISERKGALCLITNTKGDGDIVIRKLDAEGIRSLISWAWTSAI